MISISTKLLAINRVEYVKGEPLTQIRKQRVVMRKKQTWGKGRKNQKDNRKIDGLSPLSYFWKMNRCNGPSAVKRGVSISDTSSTANVWE